MKKECKWVSEIIIDSNKLYDLCIDYNSKAKNMSSESKQWVMLSTEAINDVTQWFERDLDDFLKEIHREAEDFDQVKQEEDDEKI